jgi:hypothetical protein
VNGELCNEGEGVREGSYVGEGGERNYRTLGRFAGVSKRVLRKHKQKGKGS